MDLLPDRGAGMRPMAWPDAVYYVEAGSLSGLRLSPDLTAATLEALYGDGEREATFLIECRECCYLLLRRTEHDDDPECRAILEAHLRRESPLLDDFRAHRLDGKLGVLMGLAAPGEALHLEIVGEMCVDILCSEVEVFTSLPPTEAEK